MVAEVEARVVIKKMEGQAEDWKAGRFPSPANSQCFGSFVSLHLADQRWSEENVGFVLTAGAPASCARFQRALSWLEVRSTPHWSKPDSNRRSPLQEGTDSPAALIEIVPRPARQLRKGRWDY
jgi:hypothetical protein